MKRMKIVLDAQPDVLNHNTETVPRLYRAVRSGSRYERTLRLLENAKKLSPATVTKSGVMVGLGETSAELVEVFRDLGSRGVDILTVGQYLRPSLDHLPIARFYEPEEFEYLKEEALRFGFRHVESGPLASGPAITRIAGGSDQAIVGASVLARAGAGPGAEVPGNKFERQIPSYKFQTIRLRTFAAPARARTLSTPTLEDWKWMVR